MTKLQPGVTSLYSFSKVSLSRADIDPIHGYRFGMSIALLSVVTIKEFL